MRVTRMLIYEGSPRSVQDQLAASMPDGSKQGMADCLITVFTLGTIPANVVLKLAAKAEKSDVVQLLEDLRMYIYRPRPGIMEDRISSKEYEYVERINKVLGELEEKPL